MIQGQDTLMMVADSANLSDKFAGAVKVGEIPYQSNIRAMKQFDIRDDRIKGVIEANKMLKGINSLITELEAFSNGARTVSKRASAVLRGAGNSQGHESGGSQNGATKDGFS